MSQVRDWEEIKDNSKVKDRILLLKVIKLIFLIFLYSLFLFYWNQNILYKRLFLLFIILNNVNK